MQEFLEQILQLAQEKRYEDIINLINSSDFRNDKLIYNIKKSVKKYCRMKNNSLFYNKNNKIEESDNIWQTYFQCMKSNDISKAYEVILKINNKLNNTYSNFYLILTYDLLKLNEKNYITTVNFEKINSRILNLLTESNYISDIDLKKLTKLLNEKIIQKHNNNENTYLEEQTLNIISTIEQLKNLPNSFKEMFYTFDYEGTNVENFYLALELGDYISAFKYLKKRDVFDNMKENFDKTYPLVIFKLLKTLEYECNRKYKKFYELVDNKKDLENDLRKDIIKNLTLK